MTLIADILMMAGAIAAGFYCYVLSRRLTALKNAEGGIGDAVVSLSNQVDEMTRSVAAARSAAQASSGSLSELTERAEGVAQRLELMVASMHDLPQADDKATEFQMDEPVFSRRATRVAGR